ncbi:MAG: carboxypeptidase-like regulatory domain-containing protein [bacterium]|nr:carboxypeptidase-like regulatory domain-containing protein [bacterium]
MTRRASLISFCLGILLLIGACSAGGSSPVTPDNNQNPTKYASSINGAAYKGGGPVPGTNIYVYNLDTMKLDNSAIAGTDGAFSVGVNAGQYLIFAFGRDCWRSPELTGDFSSYVNVDADQTYRLDIDLTDDLPAGEELVFGFVTSAENELSISGATITGGGRSTTSDGYGFYAMAVPAGTGDFNIVADGFYALNTNIRDGQAAGDDYFSTPFFNLNPANTSGSSFMGIARDVANGTGLGGVRVTLLMPGNTSWVPRVFLTNLGGEYRFFNLMEGIYRLNFERPGYYSVPLDGLVIKDQDDSIINVFLHRDLADTANIDGYVSKSGTMVYISGVRVTASNPLLGTYQSNTSPFGYYRLEGLVPDNYTITVVAASAGVSYYESSSTFQTVFGGENRFDFALRFIDEGVLRGNVTINGVPYSDAYPPTGVEISAEKVGGALSGVQFKTNTDYMGKFAFNGLPMGIYKVIGRAEYSTTEVYSGVLYNIPVNSGQTTSIDLDLVS